MHICYGYGIEANIKWKQTLGEHWRQYEEIFPALNRSKIDQVSLEAAGSKVPLGLIAQLPDKVIEIGVIDVATNAIETPRAIVQAMRQALNHADAERLQMSTNCGLAPLPWDVAVAKLKAPRAGAALLRAG